MNKAVKISLFKLFSNFVMYNSPCLMAECSGLTEKIFMYYIVNKENKFYRC